MAITEEQRRIVCDLYESGKSGGRIAELTDIPRHSVYRILRTQNIQRRIGSDAAQSRELKQSTIAERWSFLKIGLKIGRLTVIGKPLSFAKQGGVFFPCQCECGKWLTVRGSLLKPPARKKSCGCLKRDRASELLAARKTKHGNSRRGQETPEFKSWMAMKTRCLNQKEKTYPRWGGRGIKICPQWLGDNGFKQFLSDMGPKPSISHSLDRIDNDGDYEPSNCRWATQVQQGNNKRNNVIIEFDGKKMTIAQWANLLGIKRATLSRRLKAGWSIERALTPYVRPFKS